MGMMTHTDTHGRGVKHTPTREEMLWRFKHQTPAAIEAKFKHRTRALIRSFGLEAVAPPELLTGASQEIAPETPRVSEAKDEYIRRVPHTRRVIFLKDSEVSVEVENEEEVAFVRDLVMAWDHSYVIDAPSWRIVLPAIESLLAIDRRSRTTDKATKLEEGWQKAQNALQQQVNTIIKGFAFETRTGEDEYELNLRAIELAQTYFDKRGWRQRVQCPQCGTEIATYFLVYRSVMEFLNMVREVDALDWANAPHFKALKEKAAEILRRPVEHPYLGMDLRQLGVAWSQPVVDWAKQFKANHPEVMLAYADGMREGSDEARAKEADSKFWWEIAGLLGALFELGPVCFDPELPFSPINRAVTGADGTVQVVDASDPE
jgi:hypothetical protein